MPSAAGIVERFRTGRHTYTIQHQSNGQLVYRKDGRFTSSRSVASARSHATERQPVGTVHIENRNDLASRPLAGVADKIEGEWVAGPDSHQYDASVQPGEVIPRDKAYTLRGLRSQERRFYEFAIRQDPSLTLEELRERFGDWKEALANAESEEEKRDVMREFGWEETR